MGASERDVTDTAPEGARAGDPVALRRPRVRIALGAAVLLALVALAAAVAVALLTPGGSAAIVTPTAVATGPSPDRTGAAAGADPLYVHVLGAVARPGLYRLAAGARVVDAVAAAGGFTDAADTGSLNLARPLSDGEQVIAAAQGAAPPAAGSAASTGVVGGKVNLNTADATALETLPRIGPAMAQRILDWRAANGRFSSIEDLLGVTGIGDATFAGLKDLVTV
ncbi:MAG: ComEA family DNA-binding protein [Micrococcales bacterium]|nr:ComEA family DNA-binding protein [Micrococcales bacterium]